MMLGAPGEAGMVQRTISDDLLRTAIGLRAGAGVSTSKIEKLILRFSSRPAGQAPTGDDSSWVDPRDVPQDRRDQLLTELADLSPEPGYSPADAGRSMSAIDVWPCRVAEDAKMHRTAPVTQLTSDAGGDPEAAPHSGAIDAADRDGAETPVEETAHDEVDGEPQPREPEDRIVASSVAIPATAPEVDSMAGDITMWDRGELERIKKEIASRREEMFTRHARELRDTLARHAEELKVLDADHSELDALEQAISAIASKFKTASADTAIAA
jgi:hypothetical protein